MNILDEYAVAKSIGSVLQNMETGNILLRGSCIVESISTSWMGTWDKSLKDMAAEISLLTPGYDDCNGAENMLVTGQR